MKVFAYAQICSRGDMATIKREIDFEDLERFVNLVATSQDEDDPVQDDNPLHQELSDKYGFWSLIDDLFLADLEVSSFEDMKEQAKRKLEMLRNGKNVSVVGEEITVGYGLTKTDAKVAFAEAMADDDGEW